jgi:gas vesicle protein GvpK
VSPSRARGRRTRSWRSRCDQAERDTARALREDADASLLELFEKQAIRQMEAGTLSAEETESLGMALMKLEETIVELARRFDLSPEDFNLDLGLLGRLP